MQGYEGVWEVACYIQRVKSRNLIYKIVLDKQAILVSTQNSEQLVFVHD